MMQNTVTKIGRIWLRLRSLGGLSEHRNMSSLGSLEPQNKQEPPLFVRGSAGHAVKSPLIVTLPPFLIQLGDFLPRRAAYWLAE
jgi:hypothetical protein